MHAAQRPARYRQVARQRGPAGQHDGVELTPELNGGHDCDVGRARGAWPPGLAGLEDARGGGRFPRPGRGAVSRAGRQPDRGRAAELDALCPQLRQPAVEDPLLHLELRDPEAEEAAWRLGAFEDHDLMAGSHQLLGARQAGRAGADHRDPPAGALAGSVRPDPTLGPCPLRDLVLDPLDGDRVGVDAEHARGLARGGAQPAGELREVVGGVQALGGTEPVAPVHEVVPLGDEVPERAALVAERDPAIHAAGSLLAAALLLEGLVDLAPVAKAHLDGTAARELAAVLEEPGRLTHGRPPSRPARRTALRPWPARWPRARGGSPAASP